MSQKGQLFRKFRSLINLTQKRSSGSVKAEPSREDAKGVMSDIHNSLRSGSRNSKLTEMSVYYFDGAGKLLRPQMAMAMAKAVNSHLQKDDERLLEKQRKVALVSEMWHTSSLLHDDVIDHAETRRGKDSVNVKWGAKRSVMAGDYILANSILTLTQTGSPQVVEAMSMTLSDLVNGEFQQMKSEESDDERFDIYMEKTYNKTASLMANSCKCVAILACENDPAVVTNAFLYGRNIGIAFQLVDDLLDFVVSADQLGKPAAADLELGLATAPVLFASREYPHLKQLILRRFSEPGDVQEAFEIVLQSDGLKKTKNLSIDYANKARESITGFNDSSYKTRLMELAEFAIERCR